MSRNILFGLSSANRASKYLYYGAYDTDNIQTLLSGEIGVFWASKTNGPDADTGVFTGGGGNDDIGSAGGNNVDVDGTGVLVTNIDKFFFAQGTGNGNKAILGQVIDAKNMSFQVLEYVAPIKKVHTVTIAAASLVAGKVIDFSAYAKSTLPGMVGSSKEMNINYTIVTGDTATTIGAALKALVDAHPFSTQVASIGNRMTGLSILYSCSEAHSSDVVLTITWGVMQDGDIKNNSWATATSTIVATVAFKTGNGYGPELVELEKDIAVQKGYNPAPMASTFWTESFYASSAYNYHVIAITHYNETSDKLGANPPIGIKETQYIAIDTTNSGMELLEDIVSLLTDMVEKRTIAMLT